VIAVIVTGIYYYYYNSIVGRKRLEEGEGKGVGIPLPLLPPPLSFSVCCFNRKQQVQALHYYSSEANDNNHSKYGIN